MQRVVSLIASSTEIAVALGCEDRLVARSHECDYPRSVELLPHITSPKFRVDLPSREIDRQVKDILEQGLSVYRVDADALRRLKPDVILTQTQCEVCAVSLGDVEAALENWVGSKPAIISLEPHCLADVWSDIRKVAAGLDVVSRGEELIEELAARMSAIRERAAIMSERPTIACIEWIDPLMSGGNWVPELVAMSGGENLFGLAGQHSPWMTFEELQERDPEIVVILPCGFDIPRSRAEMPALTGQSGWQQLQAVQSGRVYLADGHQFFNRPGPRLVESLEIFAEMFHPGEFDFGHRGIGWEAL